MPGRVRPGPARDDAVRIVLTHPEPRVAALAAALGRRGHAVLPLPQRRLVPLVGEASVRARLAEAAAVDWLVFVSPGSVEAALPALQATGRWLPRRGIALIGPGTEAALRTRGLEPSPACPWVRPGRPPYDAAALLREPAFAVGPGSTLLVVRGETGRDDWIDDLRARGARVGIVAVLRSEPVDPDPGAVEVARAWLGEAGAVPLAMVFTTVDAIDRVSAALPDHGRDVAHACAVHPRQVARLQAQGWVRAELLAPGEAGLLAGIESWSTVQPPHQDPR
jgi:uroporphyrinogen-III synthase